MEWGFHRSVFKLTSVAAVAVTVVSIGLGASSSAVAESARWTITPPNDITPTTGAAICPHEDAARGSHNCLSLECVPGEPLTLVATIAGFDTPEHLRLTIDLAGEAPWHLLLRARGEGRYAIGLTGREHAAGLEALQSGASGTVTFATDAYLWRDHLPLAGSREAIDHALASCWTARTESSRAPDEAARDEVRAFCADTLNAAAVMNDGFTRQEDLDGDGALDWIVNYGAATCGAIGSGWCGWAGCETALHLARGDGYTRSFRGVAEGFRLRDGTIVFRRHASECAGSGIDPCAVAYRFTAEGLAKIGPVVWDAE